MLRGFLHSRWGQLRFVKNATQALPGISAEGGKLVVYAGREPDGLQQHANAVQVPVWRITEGLLKPDGPIVARAPTLSLLLDRNPVDKGADDDLTPALVSNLPNSASLQDAAYLRERMTELSENRYPLYFDPYRNLPCDLEHALKLLRSGFQQRSAQRAPLPALVNYLRLMLGLNRAIAPAPR